MKILLILSLVLLLGAVAANAWVRLAPSDPERWNVAEMSLPPGDYDGANSFRAVRSVTGPDAISRLDVVALETPRTERLAGDLSHGPVTWVTRSLVWGFPDYTTAWIDEAGNLSIHARSRFGRADLGVNEARVRDWLTRMGLT